jgi:hypothetical protein
VTDFVFSVETLIAKISHLNLRLFFCAGTSTVGTVQQ